MVDSSDGLASAVVAGDFNAWLDEASSGNINDLKPLGLWYSYRQQCENIPGYLAYPGAIINLVTVPNHGTSFLIPKAFVFDPDNLGSPGLPDVRSAYITMTDKNGQGLAHDHPMVAAAFSFGCEAGCPGCIQCSQDQLCINRRCVSP